VTAAVRSDSTVLCQEPSAQPSPCRLAVKVQAGRRNRDGHNPELKRRENALSSVGLFAYDPRCVDVDQWIVCDVERIRQVSEEASHPDREAVHTLFVGADATLKIGRGKRSGDDRGPISAARGVSESKNGPSVPSDYSELHVFV